MMAEQRASEQPSDKDDPEKAPETAAIAKNIAEGPSYNTTDLQSLKCEHHDEEDALLGGSGRHVCLDITRTLCVWLVCVDHGGTEFGVWNTMYVQAWVLQYLFLVCGICYAMTSKSFASFQLRLCFYFCIGVCCNLTAWLILGKDWKHDAFNVVFQFWFVFGLILFVCILAPLKALFAKTAAQEESGVLANALQSFEPGPIIFLSGYVCTLVFYILVIIPAFTSVFAQPLYTLISTVSGPGSEFWDLPTQPEEAADFVRRWMTDIQVSVINVYLVLVFPLFSRRVSLIGWLVIANTYAFKILYYRGPEARMINAFDCAMLGLICYTYGLRWRKQIGEYLMRYWFLVLFTAALLWPLGMKVRLDEHPPEDPILRARYNLLEALFLVLFLTAVERMLDSKIFTEDKLEFINYWSLVLFLVHKAVHMLVPAPFNWAVLLALAVPCYLICKKH